MELASLIKELMRNGSGETLQLINTCRHRAVRGQCWIELLLNRFSPP